MTGKAKKPARRSLGYRIAGLITAGGPMSLAEYMHICLADPKDGYYANRQAIGTGGDFITAPEISQMFGELIGIWCIAAWRALGDPDPFCLAELGPGRGVMMADLLRASHSDPAFRAAANITLIETSPAMIETQRQALDGHAVEWLPDIDGLPDMPLIVVANEFFDALPVRQYVKTERGWLESGIGLGEDKNLKRVLTAATADPAILPPDADNQPDGAVFEHAPAREALMGELAHRIKRHSGAALIIDYGHIHSGFGDTFQAVMGHAHTDPLSAPGKADLTSHVDFERLAKAAACEGVASQPLTTQGEFLIELGLLQRAGALGAYASDEVRERLQGEAERLAGPKAMGELFKVMAFSSPANALPGISAGGT